MAALTAVSARRMRKIYSWIQNFRINDAITIYVGSYTGLPGANALTSSRGRLVLWQDQVSILWCGVAEGQSATNDLSNVNAVVGDILPLPEAEIAVELGPFIEEQVAVTGVSAQSDVGRTAVYAENDNDLTTTAETYSPRVGHVLYWHTSTTADVFFHGFQTQIGSLL